MLRVAVVRELEPERTTRYAARGCLVEEEWS
jgi:hypothetical protein